ncbi:unnamed protein product, partial [Larinioides sclopetarius]
MADSKNDGKDPSHFTYIWAVENMCTDCTLVSPTFTVKEMEMTKWHIWLDVYSSEFVDIGIQREEEDDGPNSIEIKCEISFIGINGLPLMQKKRTDFLPKDTLTLRCRMWRIGTGISQLDSCFARTLLRSGHRSFIWAIREFSTLQKNQVRKIILDTD